jgi:hypothetical protein
MRSSWAVRGLLPAAQVLAEGGWLAVVYAAAQALSRGTPQVGPLELALLAWAGMAWARRSLWRSTEADAVGLPLLVLLGAAAGWFLAPEVRAALLDGRLIAALGLHPAGWLAGVAVLRGSAHSTASEESSVQQRLLRFAIPGLAVPWLVGSLATSGAVEREFTAAAFMGTLVFTASAFTALGLAHLESVRLTTGADWRENRSWLTLVVGVALTLTAAGIPAALLLGVPASALLVALFGPIRIVLLAILLLATPIVAFAAWLVSLVPIHDLTLFQPPLDFVRAEPAQAINDAPTFVFYAIVALLLVIELLFLAAIFYFRWQERRTFGSEPEAFEERAIVLPSGAAPRRPRQRHVAGPRADADDPAAAYLAALDALERDGRWPRSPSETPAEHARRIRLAGLNDPSLPRLAAAYQLVRYAGLPLSAAEAQRARPRLARLRSFLGGRR